MLRSVVVLPLAFINEVQGPPVVKIGGSFC